MSAFYIAPMMGYTDYHYRWMVRQFSRRSVLFTEMITCRALLHGPARRLLRHSPEHNPVLLQLAGSEPEDFRRAAPLGEAAGFAEININAGCPSKRADSGCFGAVLMRRPALLAELVRQTADACSLPVSVKMRLGVDELDSDDYLAELLGQIADAGCRKVYLHARKALLNGISPAQNRSVPPLNYDRARRMQRQFPELALILNGGLNLFPQILDAMEVFSGAMVGRAAYAAPSLVAKIDRSLDAEAAGAKPPDLQQFGESIRRNWGAKSAEPRLRRIYARHLMPFFRALPGSKSIRRRLAESATDSSAFTAELDGLPWRQVGDSWASVL